MIYDLIGTIYTATGNTLSDSEGNEYPEMKAVDGYHVNALDLSEDDVTKLANYVVTVSTPCRVFAGRNDAVCLKFTNRDEWLSLGYEVEDDN